MPSKLLFHGTIHLFDKPDLSKCKDRKDFGKGFYLSDDINHSKTLAKGRLMNPMSKTYKIRVLVWRQMFWRVGNGNCK